MAHQLSIRENGMVEFGFTGDRSAIWHGLGQEIPEDATIAEWISQSGLDYTIKSSPVVFFTDEGAFLQNEENNVLYRSDNNKVLGIVSPKYNVVQPAEVIGFFDELVQKHDMKLSAAGSIFGGKTYWATAKTGKNTNIMDSNDNVEGYVLLTSSADGKSATTATHTSTRVVCNNTLQVALGNAKSLYRQSHKSMFNVNQAYLDLGLVESSWTQYVNSLHKLAETKMTDEQVRQFYREMYENEHKEVSKTNEKNIDSLWGLYNTGAGANVIRGTAWGALNAVTNMYTHGNGRKRDASGVFQSSYLGEWAKIKSNAMNKLLEAA